MQDIAKPAAVSCGLPILVLFMPKKPQELAQSKSLCP